MGKRDSQPTVEVERSPPLNQTVCDQTARYGMLGRNGFFTKGDSVDANSCK
jgi:hypothetical protein